MKPQGSILVTGCNGGLGTAIVKRILQTPGYADYHAIYTVRKIETASALDKVLSLATPTHKYEKVSLDLSSLDNVRRVANWVNQRVTDGRLPPIRVLVLNAGYQEHETQSFSIDGFDMSFQCNYLSNWLLTLMLLGSMDKDQGRIVVVGSATHDPSNHRNASMGFFKGDEWKQIYSTADVLAKGTWSSAKEFPNSSGGMRRYGASKLCVSMFVYSLQTRIDKDPLLSNISVLVVDPGAMPSSLGRRAGVMLRTVVYILPLFARINTFFSPNGFFRTTDKSAGDVLRAALNTTDFVEKPKALYLDGSERFHSSPESKNQAKQNELWLATVNYTQIKPEDTLLFSLD